MRESFSFVCSLTLLVTPVPAQKDIPPTETITISGAVEKESTIRFADLAPFTATALPDVAITNHLGEPRGTAKGLSGIPMKDVLAKIQIKAENPKVWSEFYLSFVASDGYTVVYSWNALFNSPTGDNTFLITQKDGKHLTEIPERMLVITVTDYKTGRRNIKGLAKIVVGRAKG